MLAPLSVSSAFLVSPHFTFVSFLICSVLWSAAFLTQDVALGRFGLAVTLGVALAATFPILFLIFLHGGSYPLFYFFNFFSCPLVPPFLSDQDFRDVDNDCLGLLTVRRVVL